MAKKFNTRGTCNPQMHYMVDISGKIEKIRKLVEDGEYFTINRPRQYGKTTTLFLLKKRLTEGGYLVISLSFAGLGDLIFEDERVFSREFLDSMADSISLSGSEELAGYLLKNVKKVESLKELSKVITGFIKKSALKVALMIDEVDKSSNNQLFVSFLGMLREKYLLRNAGEDYTFHSVILAGVHDVKTLKLKIRPDEQKKYNSPWNISADFKVDMSFSAEEIATMLEEYCTDKQISMDIPQTSERLRYYTSGYPFLVSRLCEIIDKDILPEKNAKEWRTEYLEDAFRILLKESNPNFDDLVKNLENNEELYDFAMSIVVDGAQVGYNIHNPLINLGSLYGILREVNGKVAVHNKIYEHILFNYMTSKIELKTNMSGYNFQNNFISGKTLDMEKILLKFQQFMKEQYSSIDEKFIEREGKLLFLAFIKPIINGMGFDFKEVQTSEEKRLDVVITFLNGRYIVELKIWRGQEAHKRGLVQLKDYLDRTGSDKGYLVIFEFIKNKNYSQDRQTVDGKEIFIVKV